MSEQKAFGDFQTPPDFAREVTALVAQLFPAPTRIIEPTAGKGAFLKGAYDQWGASCSYVGYEINPDYVAEVSDLLNPLGIVMLQRDFFTEDWQVILNQSPDPRVLVIGNPPWVTNAELGVLESKNLPEKSNDQGMRGLDARTGKANFDIAEWMIMRLVEALPAQGALAVLCKTMTARKVLRQLWKGDQARKQACLFRLDAHAVFNVAVDACLFFMSGEPSDERTATIYAGLDLASASSTFGFVDGELVSDIEHYTRHRAFDGGSAYTWRSGVKHDAAKVMELTRADGAFVNGYGDTVELEPDYLYPLLKSSDLGNGRVTPRKWVLIPQKKTGEDTAEIAEKAPKTWQYLLDHGAALDGRKSSIYRKRSRFCIFGIGEYSFAPWKVGISGLYKSFTFVVVPPVDGRAVMVDDTCYTIPCETEAEATLLCELLNTPEAQAFMASLVFTDAKRPVTVDVLKRLSLVALAEACGRLEELTSQVSHWADLAGRAGPNEQLSLLPETYS
ncbi:MAG: hypothetical protein ACI97B_001057 [Verrucomicrobiales bacterium]